jgi:predicted nucleic acid-binding protein
MIDVAYYDSSALVKKYVHEVGSAYMNGLITDRRIIHFISKLTLVEVSAALLRRAAPADITRVLVDFDHDASTLYTAMTLDDVVVGEAHRLVRSHRLRGCDALQLATALRIAHRIPGLLFVAADDELNRAAQTEGLAVENPNWHP